MFPTVVGGTPYTCWVPIKPTATIHVGDLVCIDTSGLEEGFVIREQADGDDNDDNYDIPFGICIGTNEANPRFSTSAKAEYTTDGGLTDPHNGAARDYSLVEGPWSKGDSGNRAMIKVQLTPPGSIIRMPIYNNAPGTAISELTATSGATTGLSAVTSACDFTPVADLCTIYCRKGGNAGVYRVTDDTSTVSPTWDVAMPQDTAAGDVFVRVPLRVGLSYIRIGDDSVSSYINASETPAGDYDSVVVTKLDLRVKGEEFAEFYFNTKAYMPAGFTT